MSVGQDGYKRTVFDRQGPEAAHFLQTVSSLIIPIVGGAFIGGGLAVQKDFSPPVIALSVVSGSIVFEAPSDPQPRIRAADLYAKSGLRERAEELYRAVQRLPRVAPRDDIYVSNRLVDLYLAWPGHEKSGLRELRRLIDTYPETDVATRARAGLVNLKSQLGEAE
jgi:hypothetical protein